MICRRIRVVDAGAEHGDGRAFGSEAAPVGGCVDSLREAGDVIMAIVEGTIGADDLVPLRDVLTGATSVPAGRPLVFKSVGMSWEDIVIANAVVERHPS